MGTVEASRVQPAIGATARRFARTVITLATRSERARDVLRVLQRRVETLDTNNVRIQPVYIVVHIVRVALARTRIDRDGRAVQLMPGMTTTADIVTGSRSYLSYLTSPIAEAGGSALRER